MATLAWAYFQSMQQESQNYAIGRSYASCIESVSLIKQNKAIQLKNTAEEEEAYWRHSDFVVDIKIVPNMSLDNGGQWDKL